MSGSRCIETVDLFCGAGGATTGLEVALSRLGMTHRGIAINHWRVAIDTMAANHPAVDARQMSVEEAVPADMVPGGVVDLLWASPSCTHHSRAKGGRPCSNQLRAQPDLILSWLDQLFVRRVIVENVPEIVDWGPLGLDGRPLRSKVGACFRAWIAAIEARNYIVEWRIVNCADYGDATTRRRFFLKAVRRGCGKIAWPEPTHSENPQPDLFGNTPKPWRAIRECLDFDDIGKSIFDRKHPLAANTMRRIACGLRKFCGMEFQMDMLGADGGDDSRVRTLDEPIRTQTAGGNRTAILRPFLVTEQMNNAPRSIDEPIRSQTCVRKDYLCQPFVLDHFQNGTAESTEFPIGTQTTHGRYSVVQPLVLGQQGGAHCRPVTDPCPTIATSGAIRLITPFVVDNANGGTIRSSLEPMNTVTTKDQHMGVFPMLADGRIIDIRMRMLKPSELAAAHSFPPDYALAGNLTEQIKQIGNSVPVRTAAAMCGSDLEAMGY